MVVSTPSRRSWISASILDMVEQGGTWTYAELAERIYGRSERKHLHAIGRACRRMVERGELIWGEERPVPGRRTLDNIQPGFVARNGGRLKTVRGPLTEEERVMQAMFRVAIRAAMPKTWLTETTHAERKRLLDGAGIQY